MIAIVSRLCTQDTNRCWHPDLLPHRQNRRPTKRATVESTYTVLYICLKIRVTVRVASTESSAAPQRKTPRREICRGLLYYTHIICVCIDNARSRVRSRVRDFTECVRAFGKRGRARAHNDCIK